jgi:ATP-dependent Lon protease
MSDNTPDFAAMDDNAIGRHIEATVTDVRSANSFDDSTTGDLEGKMADAFDGLTIEALSPAMRKSIQSKLDGTPVSMLAQRTKQLIREELEANSFDQKLKAGIASDANAYQREMFDMSRELHQYNRQIGQAQERLNEVASYDPETGQPVHRVTGEQRRQLDAELKRLQYAQANLIGMEGDTRLAKAKAQAVADIRASAQQIEEHREADRRADQMVREARINRMAEAKARMRTPTL